MSIIHELEHALAYMETHLLEPITYEDVAADLYVSSYHFHRCFSLIAGMSPTEYLRKRRLSLAGQELLVSEEKIIDLAARYGYETPESFTKAFTRFHGVSPSLAKKTGHALQTFAPLKIKLTLEGGNSLEYRIVERDPFTLITQKRAFKNEVITAGNNHEITDFWQEACPNHILDRLRKHTTETEIYGVCAPISKEATTFDYGIGMVYQHGEVPEDFDLWDVSPTLWAVFKCLGTEPSCIAETWHKVFTEFLPTAHYTLLDDSDFEIYSDQFEPGCFCEIWLPVAKKAAS